MDSQAAKLRRMIQQAFHYHQSGSLHEAEKIYCQILHQDPENADANHLFGVLALQSGNNQKAVEFISRAVAQNPHQPAFYNNLGNAYKAQGLLDKSIEAYQSALRIKSDYSDALYNLGNSLQETGRLAEAVQIYRQVHKQQPGSPDVLNNLANALLEMGRLAEAADSLNKSLAVAPDSPESHNTLGSIRKDQGKLNGALQSFQKALDLNPDFIKAHSNLLYTLNYLPDITQEKIFLESRQWDLQHTAGIKQNTKFYENVDDHRRRLRIGYVSPDFKSHSVAYFIEPVLASHSKENVEIFCYADVKKADKATLRLQTVSDNWVSIVGRSDADVARQIMKDKIDILVDLAGHTGNNRLLIFAGKVAPVQVTWLGYPNTTGMAAMDYRLTDAVADPFGSADNLYSEALVRLEHGFLCYQADIQASGVSAAPFLHNKHITFGSFNNLTKVGPAVVRSWAHILHAIPGSRLLLKAKQLADMDTGISCLNLFEEAGIAADRIELQCWCAEKKDHFSLYSRVDIGLDPFPYNGTTTTCEAMWMGVPVITLEGSRHAGRVGASIMQQVGLQELIAENIEEYITMAQTLAEDQQRLAEIRRTLRDRMRVSPLMDRERFTAILEDAFRHMWKNWCRKRS